METVSGLEGGRRKRIEEVGLITQIGISQTGRMEQGAEMAEVC